MLFFVELSGEAFSVELIDFGKCATTLVFLGLTGLPTFAASLGFPIDLTLDIDFLGVKAVGLIGLLGVLFAIIFTGEAAFLSEISSLLLLVDSLLAACC